MKKIIFFLIILILSSKTFASDKYNIIENLKNIQNLTFNFEQNINGKIENGTCTIEYPKKIFCNYVKKIDSRTILGEQGAEQLLGKGDMLYMSSANKIVRIHAPFVSDTEIEKINNFLRSQAEPD